MSGYFDETGNLWIGVDLQTVPDDLPKQLQGLLNLSNRTRDINLTAYIRHLKQPARS